MPYTFPSFSNLGIYPLASSHLKYLNKTVNWQCAGTELAYTCMYSLCRGVPDGIMSLCHYALWAKITTKFNSPNIVVLLSPT